MYPVIHTLSSSMQVRALESPGGGAALAMWLLDAADDEDDGDAETDAFRFNSGGDDTDPDAVADFYAEAEADFEGDASGAGDDAGPAAGFGAGDGFGAFADLSAGRAGGTGGVAEWRRQLRAEQVHYTNLNDLSHCHTASATLLNYILLYHYLTPYDHTTIRPYY